MPSQAALGAATVPLPAGAPIPWPTVRMAAWLALVAALSPALFQPRPQPAAQPGFEALDTGGLPEIRSSHGVLQVTFVAAPQTIRRDGVTIPAETYNGVYGGPVLRLHPGDVLRLRLVNHLPDATNLHFHGLRVTPTGHGDNMHISVPPGGFFDYELHIPLDHPPGVFWYHDHLHGRAEAHVNAGLSGPIVIDGFARQFQTLDWVPQKLLVLEDWNSPGCAGERLKTQLHCRVMTINNGAPFTDSLAARSPHIWRISNQGADLIIHLAAPGLHFTIIGRDGLATTFPVETEILDIMPSSRQDVLVRADSPGQFPLFATNVLTGSGADFATRRVLGTVQVSGAPAAPVAAPIFPDKQDLRAQPPDARRIIHFTETADATIYGIDGRVFDPRRIDVRVRLGTVEEWTIRNTTPDFHEFHIHQLGFQLTEINGVSQKFAGFIDDVDVPANGEIKILIPFTDPRIVGHFMFHCHVLKHEDRGMMANIEVVRPGFAHICRTPGAW